jgi:hypothetical protein
MLGGPKADLDAVDHKENLTLPGIKLLPSSLSLCRLSYPGSSLKQILVLV